MRNFTSIAHRLNQHARTEQMIESMRQSELDRVADCSKHALMKTMEIKEQCERSIILAADGVQKLRIQHGLNSVKL